LILENMADSTADLLDLAVRLVGQGISANASSGLVKHGGGHDEGCEGEHNDR
jgi:hypothetical protein